MAEKIGSVLVVGGGIGGLQAALDLAEADFKVYVMEKQPSIGGVMAQLDKTFPTNDCAMCTMATRLVEVARHHNVELLTNTDLVSVKGHAGNFRAEVLVALGHRRPEGLNGGIVLMHLGTHRRTDRPHESLPEILTALQDQGYRLVTLSELLRGLPTDQTPPHATPSSPADDGQLPPQ